MTINKELKVIAVVQFNKGEALVLNRKVNFIYEQVGKDFIGTDGPFVNGLYYSPASGSFKAFAGRELTLNMNDGTQREIKDHWWAGTKTGLIDAVVGDINSLKKCYVFGSASMRKEDYDELRASYTGCVFPYWDYEKVIKFDDMRKSLYAKVSHGEKRIKALISEVKKMNGVILDLRSDSGGAA